ncbi:hypothetical protein [Pedobacter sp. PACM 27299]|nr:hypothetical protein [Pedobacter sp. PACM 27299]
MKRRVFLKSGMTTAALLHIGVVGEALASTASFPDRPIDEMLKNVDNEVK